MDEQTRSEYEEELREPEPAEFSVKPEADFAVQNSEDDFTADLEDDPEMTGAALSVSSLNGAGVVQDHDRLAREQLAREQLSREQLAAERLEANREEEQIVARVLTGDQDAFALLVERYRVAVFNLCSRMLGDPTEAEDASQEVFVRAYTQLRTYQTGRKFSTWILSIASHYCIDMLRRRKPIVDLESIAFWKQSDLPEPEDIAITDETRDEVRDLLNYLPQKYRGVTVLRYWNDLSYEEIAKATDLSVATVKTRLFRAREMLAKELESRNRNGSRPGDDQKNNRRSLLRLRSK